MQDAIAGSWTRESPLSAATLGSLHDLNHRFLDLAALQCDRWARSGRTSPAALVAPLSAAQRAAAAQCPYSLFDLKFQDDAYWQLRIQNSSPWRVADASVIDDDTVCFTRLALFYAWHVASRDGLAAQLLLGMNTNTAAAFRRITVNHLPVLAASEASNLGARWSECTVFWSGLAAAAVRTNRSALRRVQLYGVQLAAAARLPRS